MLKPTECEVSRRTVIAGSVAILTVIPAVGLAKGADGPGSDPLLERIVRYRAEVDALNASRGLTEDEVGAWVDKADAILIEAVELPVMTAAGALAVLSLSIDDGWTLSQHSVYGDEFKALASAARNFLASVVVALD